MSGAEKLIWRDDAFQDDAWTRAPADAAELPAGPALVPLATFLEDPSRFLGRNAPLGVEVLPGEDVKPLAAHLDRLQLIALVFPKFSDGRSYSAARLLRERFGYQGEVRATGEVLSDQVPLMRRCGFDSFEVRHGPTRQALSAGRLAEVRHYYQPLPLAPEVPPGTRPWARRPGDASQETKV
jgi:phosphoadenosine phosphosulfate reductase